MLSPSTNSTTHFALLKALHRNPVKQSEPNDHHHRVEERVEMRTEQLIEARRRAEIANQAKSAYLVNMSHEIRTPMNAILGLTYLMRGADPTPEQGKRLIQIDTSARHLLSIINNILDIAKIEAGKLTLEQSEFHLDELFDHTRTLLKEQAELNGLSIEIDPISVPCQLRGDITRLRQCLLNYTSNAVKFSKQGTIHLRVKKLQENDKGILLKFEVQDPGIGIEPDKLPNLFKAYEQVKVSTTREYGGTGLGLTINRRLAQLMGGEVGVESEPGQGSTFWFTALLGYGRSGVAKAIPDKMQLGSCHACSRILLVEDNAINRQVALALLDESGLVVDTAENGREAVAMVRSTTYDLVLMDIQMPEMNGLEATRLIRSMPNSTASSKDVPILAMTASVFSEDRHDCMEAGMNDFVAKPVKPENLLSSIAKWLPEREPVT
jgi:signal transduction histidine kinase/ActR/RegA family two-component response regulator